MNFILRQIREHLIRPFQDSDAPIPRIAWGATIGMLVGMTPTMGIQMYVAAMIWIISRYVFRFRFNLPIAVAMVWISNPVTVLPLYWSFLLTGDWVLNLAGWPQVPRDFEVFKALLVNHGNATAAEMADRIETGVLLMFWSFGWPMLVGSLLWAVPLTVLTYPVTTLAMLKYRTFLARQEGLSYQEWKQRHINRE